MVNDDEKETTQAVPAGTSNSGSIPKDERHTSVETVQNMRIPAFWRQRPKLWFAQIESQFISNRITSDNTKYHAIVSSLEAMVLEEIADIVENPPAECKYEQLKRQLIARFTESPEDQLSKALSELELGDMKPSQLWRKMRSMVGDQIGGNSLKTFWLKKLPARVREILTVTASIEVEALTEVADKIMKERNDYSTVAGISKSTSPVPESINIATLCSEIANLTKRLDELTTTESKRYRYRSRSRSSSKNRAGPDSGESLCYYHKKFGKDARRCTLPCSFKKDSKN